MGTGEVRRRRVRGEFVLRRFRFLIITFHIASHVASFLAHS